MVNINKKDLFIKLNDYYDDDFKDSLEFVAKNSFEVWKLKETNKDIICGNIIYADTSIFIIDIVCFDQCKGYSKKFINFLLETYNVPIYGEAWPDVWEFWYKCGANHVKEDSGLISFVINPKLKV